MLASEDLREGAMLGDNYTSHYRASEYDWQMGVEFYAFGKGCTAKKDLSRLFPDFGGNFELGHATRLHAPPLISDQMGEIRRA